MTDMDPREIMAKVLESKRAKQAEIDAIDQAIAEVVPKSSVTVLSTEPVDPVVMMSEPMKPGVRTSELWLAALLPIIVGAVVQLGWLSEQAATELGMVGGGSYVIGRSIAKAVAEWVKR